MVERERVVVQGGGGRRFSEGSSKGKIWRRKRRRWVGESGGARDKEK